MPLEPDTRALQAEMEEDRYLAGQRQEALLEALAGIKEAVCGLRRSVDKQTVLFLSERGMVADMSPEQRSRLQKVLTGVLVRAMGDLES